MGLRLSAAKNLDAAEATALTTHRSSDGTDHADVVSGTTELAQMERIVVTGLAMDSVNEDSVAIGGSSANEWVPLQLIVHLEDDGVAGGATGDMQVQVGTSAGGTQILGATATTNLKLLNDRFMVDLSGLTASITADSTIYVKVAVRDTTAAGYKVDAYILGQVFVSGT